MSAPTPSTTSTQAALAAASAASASAGGVRALAPLAAAAGASGSSGVSGPVAKLPTMEASKPPIEAADETGWHNPNASYWASLVVRGLIDAPDEEGRKGQEK